MLLTPDTALERPRLMFGRPGSALADLAEPRLLDLVTVYIEDSVGNRSRMGTSGVGAVGRSGGGLGAGLRRITGTLLDLLSTGATGELR